MTVVHRNSLACLQRILWLHIVFLWCLLSLFAQQNVAEEKRRYAFQDLCDRYSLDAVYYEKFKPTTAEIIKQQQNFVNKIADLVSDSLIRVMADLPDRDVSSNEERRIFNQFQSVKSTFGSRVKKIQRNITSVFESLVATHFDLMYDNGKTSLQEYLNKTLNMTESYSGARKSLDSNIGSFSTFIKSTIRDGLEGIKAAAQDALRHVEEKKKRKKAEDDEDDETEKDSEESSSDEEDDVNIRTEEDKEKFLETKRLEIAEMIVPGFLGNVTMEVLKRKIDLHRKVNVTAEERESPFDDLLFDILMIRNRIRAIIQPDISDDKGSVDLARRSVYTYWAELANKMYKERVRSKEEQSEKEEASEEQLVEKILNMMENYP
ncbi:uncharacterized protein LOC129230061 [Uloborus diversus]|uniref:uncharacterized protein LOC129230061 n=1 Tax=Uloborus diversus TaxID=327109 RepID=UPI00240A58CA|nr:uncharacterized protein LOC129230061 [Uloborus diversus]